MKPGWLLPIVLVLAQASCGLPAPTPGSTSLQPDKSSTSAEPAPSQTTRPAIAPGQGRLVIGLAELPEAVVVRPIVDPFLIGVGTTSPRGCLPRKTFQELRARGLNYLLPFVTWASVERQRGKYTGQPCPGDDLIEAAARSGATLNAHCAVFMLDQPWVIPSFAHGRSYEQQKEMMEEFIRAAVRRYPAIEIWTLNEPVDANALGWTREQIYDLFVSAAEWIHESRAGARVMLNLVPISNDWSGLHYDPHQVLEDLLALGMDIDIIGIEFYQGFFAVTPPASYPTLSQAADLLDPFKEYRLPVIFSEVGVPAKVDGQDKSEDQADWLEAFFRFAHDDPAVIGAVWYYVLDDPGFAPYYGLANRDYSLRPAGERLLSLAEEWNPSSNVDLAGKDYMDLAPGEYDVVLGQEVYRVSIVQGQQSAAPPK